MGGDGKGIRADRVRFQEAAQRLHELLAYSDTPVWEQELVGEVPEDVTPLFMKLAEGKPLYIARRRGLWQVIWGEWESDFFRREPYACDVTDGIVHYLIREVEAERVYIRGTMKTVLPACDGMSVVRIINKGLAYSCRRGDEVFLVRGRQERKVPYEFIQDLTWVNDRPLFVGIRGKERFIVMDQTETRISSSGEIFDLQYAEGKPLYGLSKPSETKDTLVMWGDELYASLTSIEHLTFAEGRPLFIGIRAQRAAIALGGWHRSLVHGHEDIADLGQAIVDRLQVVGNRIALVERRDTQSLVSWGFPETESPLYRFIFSPHVEGDALVFGARKGREIYRVSARFPVR